MARRNLLRSLAAASLLAVTSGALLAGAATPAAAVDNNVITVTVTDSGFTQTDIQARVGDHLIFRLDDAAQEPHTLAWDGGQIRYQFSRPGRTSTELPMRNAGKAAFFDSDHVGPNDPNAGPFAGTLTVTDAPPPPPDTTSSSTSTTVTTAVQPTTTTVTTARPEPTTTVFPPTTQTTGFTTIHPMLVADPGPTATTTTTAPKKKDAPADKGKAKAAGTETPTTATPAPPGPPPVEPIFDPATLTPGPTAPPAGDITAVVGSADANLDASAAASLLSTDKPANDSVLMLIALSGLVVFLMAAVLWRWHHRSSRYFPA